MAAPTEEYARVSELEAAAAAKAEELRQIRDELQVVREAQLADYVLALREDIRARGFPLDAVIRALAGAAKPRKDTTRTSTRQRWRLKTDPHCVYAGQGQLPACVLEQMRAQGLDPARAEDRKQFMTTFMEPETA
ncbi:MAG: hypothetical protein EOM91_22985 [Sphingobacteriia bacterium]|nr:hypothetical protein [Sphingobacteriia bacterium]